MEVELLGHCLVQGGATATELLAGRHERRRRVAKVALQLRLAHEGLVGEVLRRLG